MDCKSKITLAFLALPILYGGYSLIASQYSAALNSLFSAACIVVFMLIHKKFSILTAGTYYAAVAFILLSVFAGRTLNFYAHIPFWDKLLHFLSGFLFIPAGRQIYIKVGGNTEDKWLYTLFALFFAVAAAGFWEIYEFFSDKILGTTSQNNSLSDTMWDMTAGTLSAVIMIAALPLLKLIFFTKKDK